MIFTVDIFDVCPVTGSTVYTLQWFLNKGEPIQYESDSCHSEAKARNYIISMARDAILIRLEQFLKSVKKISVNNFYYSSTDKAQTVTYLWNSLYDLNQKEFKQICQDISSMKDKVYSVLPPEKHSERKALLSDISEIIGFARKYSDVNHFFPVTI